MKNIVYGRLAYEGFAKALGSRLGIKVRVEEGAHAAINAEGTITLPALSNYQTAEEFAVTCGTVVHEMAHQFYGSHKLIDPNRARLEHDCLNTVLDVADETWVSKWFEQAANKRPGELLTLGNLDAINKNEALYDWGNPSTHCWKILCTGILDARISRNRRLNRIKRRNASNAAPHVNARKVWTMIKRAKCGKNRDPKPDAKRFKRLVELAKAIAAELAPFTPPECSPMPGPIGLPGALGKGCKCKPAGAVEATDADGSSMAKGESKVGGETGNTGGGYQANANTFQLIHRPVARIAQRIAVDGDGSDFADGLTNGPRLGQVHRLLTDGQALARWTENDHAEGISASVLLDCSGSMDCRLSECAGIARAFALAMKECGKVQSLIFGSTVKETDSFDSVQTLGGTKTELAIRDATKWLGGRRGSKWIICITDGQPNDQDAVDARCEEAHAAGIKVLAIGLKCKIAMPHAKCVTADDVTHLAIELEQAARRIEAVQNSSRGRPAGRPRKGEHDD